VAKIAFLTRGDIDWGLGHLHRLSWMLRDLRGSGVPELTWRIFCLDSPPARAFHWHAGEAVTFTLTPVQDACAWRADLAVVDWLDSQPDDVSALALSGARVALLDDYGPAQALAHLVINALLSPLTGADYTVAQTRVLCGAPYVQFPQEVYQLRGEASATVKAAEHMLATPLLRRISGMEQEPAQAVLVSFGGQAVTPAVALAVETLSLARYTGKVIVIPAPSMGSREIPAAGVDCMLDIEWHPAGPDFHLLLAASDLAILAGGLSLYEAAFLGVPAICVGLNDHQLATARKLEAAGVCRLGGKLGSLTPAELAPRLGSLLRSSDLRWRMSGKGMALFDGLGLKRTMEAIIALL
jgi:spore coat polysaccharide biosynthesis predicted glycosyltransferase SpsG